MALIRSIADWVVELQSAKCSLWDDKTKKRCEKHAVQICEKCKDAYCPDHLQLPQRGFTIIWCPCDADDDDE